MKGIVIDNPEWELDEKKQKYVENQRIYVVDENFQLWLIKQSPPLPEIMSEVKIKNGERITYEELTGVAKSNLKDAIKKLIQDQKDLFIEFINRPPQISIRMNSLELLPGIGKKTARKILQSTPVKDLDKKLLEAIAERILIEMKGNEKYTLFVGENSYIQNLRKRDPRANSPRRQQEQGRPSPRRRPYRSEQP